MNLILALDFGLAVGAALLMIVINVRRWFHLDTPERLVRVGYVTLLLTLAYGTAEVRTTAYTNGFRFVMLLISLSYIVIALIWMAWRQRKRKPRTSSR